MGYHEQQEELRREISKVPARFGLRAFPGEEFFVHAASSYYGSAGVMLYTYVRRDGQSLAFAKGTVGELRANICRPPNATTTEASAVEMYVRG